MKISPAYAVAVCVLGSLCAIMLVGGIGMMLWELGRRVPLTSRSDASYQSEEYKRIDADRARERDALAQSQGLYTRYTVESLLGDHREQLYALREFEAIETWLASLYEERDDPLHFHNYYRTMYMLCEIEHGRSPEEMREVLDDWIGRYPDSYRARFIRGRFLIEHGWHVQPGEMGDPFRGRARDLLMEAEADLRAAQAMNPDDPNPSAALILVAMGLEQGKAEIDLAYAKTIEIDPTNLVARYNRLHALLPSVGGYWEDVEGVVSESESAKSRFPLLGVIHRYGVRLLAEKGKKERAIANASDTKRSYVEPYLAQLEENPGDLMLLCNVAYYAYKSRDYERAAEYFALVGDRFHKNSSFEDLLEFNDCRATTLVKIALDQPQPFQSEQLMNALEMAPNHYYTNYAYGLALLEEGKLEEARQMLEYATTCESEHYLPWAGMARLAYESGNCPEAVEMVEKSIQLGASGEDLHWLDRIVRECGQAAFLDPTGQPAVEQ